jgi:hypothetical protein
MSIIFSENEINKTENLKTNLIKKSIEAFVVGIELYNKPSIKYRVEGFSFFMCNAWELMLKAHMINAFGADAIYYKDNPKRTLSIENCIQKIFTNKNDPLRVNLEKIIELRNTSTHFIIEEYEMVYIPLFQSCIFNFNEKMTYFHKRDMTEIIPQNFLTLSVNMKSFNINEIRAKYPEQLSSKIIETEKKISTLSMNNNDSFSIRIEHYHFITKDPSKATSFIYIDKNAENSGTIIKDLKDPNQTHKYTMKKFNYELNKRLEKLNINIKFNQHIFILFCAYYGIKKNEKFCYVNTIGSAPTYSYSIQAIEFIVEEIKKDPENIIKNLKNKLVQNKS